MHIACSAVAHAHAEKTPVGYDHFFEISRWSLKVSGSSIVFQGQYLPSLSVNYVAISKDLEKLTPQLY